jgi:phosphonate transport system substrate-binding protein
MDMAGAVSRFLGIVAVCILAQASWLADAAVQQTDRLVFGIHPYLPAAEVQKRFKPLIDYLSSQLDRQIELRVSKNYETHIENVGNNIFDIAYMGPSSYVGMTEKFGMRPLLARLEVNGKPDFHGYIVTRKDSPVQALEQLAGRRFAFGSAHSTMSYLVPRHMLKRAGVGLEQLGNYTFLGNHRNVALGVLIGEFDAGAVKERCLMSSGRVACVNWRPHRPYPNMYSLAGLICLRNRDRKFNRQCFPCPGPSRAERYSSPSKRP